jgi:uncharacterized Rmd1/YagE family protein
MCKGDACSISATEIFIKKGEGSYIYVQNYGEVAFSGCSDEVIAEFLRLVAPHVETPVALGKEYKEDFIIQVNPGQKLKFGYNSIQVPELNADVIKIAMLNVSQSVVLDHFTELSQALLHQTSKYSRELELKGKIKTSKTRLMKFMGKALNIQNRITDNLYFLDAPDTVWENEYLSQINNGLSATFHLKTRFREVEYTLKIIDNNLVIFSQLVQHRDANKLEWIIILLIFFELAHALLSKYL